MTFTLRQFRLPVLFAAIAALSPTGASADTDDLRTFVLADGTEVETRVYPADGDSLILGFACDEGESDNEETTAARLAADGVEVWMPDMLSAFWLPDLPSSIEQIPAAAIAELARDAYRDTGKDVYLMAGGRDTELVLRGLARLERDGDSPNKVRGGIMLFPRLLKGEPEPGMEPEYIAPVGATTSPLIVLEGGNTPNRWGLPHLIDALGGGGSEVQSLVVPDVRGSFYTRADSSGTEDVVTGRLHGLIKASLYQLRNSK
jgi:hypothetical protein